MAKLFPDLDTIKKLKPQPEEGEWALLKMLCNNLGDEYEIYFQPFLNGDNPDIILMRKNGGVVIFEVKDIALIHYEINFGKKWFLKKGKIPKESPIEQVLRYKTNMYNLHIDHLYEYKLKEPKYWQVVKCAVYFHNETHFNIEKFLKSPFISEKSEENPNFNNVALEKYDYFLDKNIKIFGNDNLTKENLYNYLDKNWISRKSKFFNDTLYDSFKRYLKPPFHSLENTRSYIFTSQQKHLVESKIGEQKIRGTAGSGKTLTLATRAVNAHLRTKDKVLILTYNIALKNYIHDRISYVREEFAWSNFIIANYHDFFNGQMSKMNLRFDFEENDQLEGDSLGSFLDKNYYSNLDFFEDCKEQTPKFQTILIDEFQDYKEEWARIIKKYFLAENGELVIFGDWGQDIYNRHNGSFEKTPIKGRWNELNRSFRQLNPKLTILTVEFQKRYFKDRYEDYDKPIQLSILQRSDNQEFIDYEYFDNASNDFISEYIYNKIKQLNIHPNDACVLTFSNDTVRVIDKAYRNISKEKTKTTTETVEVVEFLDSNNKLSRREIDTIRKLKKYAFWMNCGMLKISTIYSFKGWEIHTLFLLIDGTSKSSNLDELIYTGFTRCSNNLIILNIGNKRFDAFYKDIENLLK
jgi:hypothetical protein